MFEQKNLYKYIINKKLKATVKYTQFCADD